MLEIQQPALLQVATFGGGKASIVVAVIPENAVVHGQTVEEIAQNKEFPNDCIIAGIFRPTSGDFIIPRGQVTVEAGDRVYLAASTDEIRRAARYLGVK